MRVKYQKAEGKPAKKKKAPIVKVPAVEPVETEVKPTGPRVASFNPKAHNFVETSIKHLPRGARVLDLGCGEGGNALFLARKGFDVVALDIKKESVAKLKAQAELEELKIEALVKDVYTYLKDCEEFDVIFGINILQFIQSNKIKAVIGAIKRKTKPYGLNIISSFLAKDKAQKGIIISKGGYLFYKNELASTYKDQKILFYEEKVVNARGHDKKPTKNFIVKMISQKNK